MNEHRIRQIFVVSVLLKGAHAVIECVGGAALGLISTTNIVNLVNILTQEELVQKQDDFIWRHLLAWAQVPCVSTKNFYAFYVLSHGVVKLLLVVGLLRGKLWS